jgi:hypothetical protein
MSAEVAFILLIRRFLPCLILCLACWKHFEIPAEATTALNVNWNSAPDTNVVGYNLYYGTVSQQYTNVIDAGNATNTTICGVVPGTTYYFAATSYTSSGWESTYSAEISYTVPPAPLPLVSIAPTSGGFNISVNGTAAFPYVILASSDLVNWVTLATNSAPFVFTDLNSSNYSQRFYQAVPASQL